MATKPEDTALPTRRAIAAALAALPAASVPMLAHAAAANPNPIFALIAAHKALDKEWSRLANALHRAEADAETHGKQPEIWTSWRRCTAQSESSIDYWRNEFLTESGANREQIENLPPPRRLPLIGISARASRRCVINLSAAETLRNKPAYKWP